MRVVRCDFLVHLTQVQNAVNLPNQMISRHHSIEIKRIRSQHGSYCRSHHLADAL